MLNFLRGISLANSFLQQESEIGSCLQKVVKVLGESTQADRCYIFTNKLDTDGNLKLYYTQEWCNVGIEPYLGDPSLSGHTYDTFPGLYDSFINNRAFFGLVKEITNKKFKKTMEMQGIQSYLFTPIFCDGNFWGWMGYDDCSHERNWEQYDVDVLFSVANNIGLRLHREQSESKFKVAEARLNLATSVSKQGLWEWDLKNHKLTFSEYFMEMLGYKHHEFEHTYQNWITRINPNDLPITEKNLQDYLKKNIDSFTTEHRIRHKEGHEIWVLVGGIANWDKAGKPEYMIGTQMDINQLKTQQLDILQQRNEYDLLINNLAEAVFKLNKKMEFSFINDFWFNISGYSKAESLHTSILDYIIENDRDLAEECFHSLSVKQDSFVKELRIKNKNGKIQWVKIIAKRFPIGINYDHSEIAGFIIDITNRKEAEQKALDLAELKSNFVAMASHQFRTPLTVIYSNIELLDNYNGQIEKKIASRISNLGERIKAEVNRMSDLMNNILLFGKYGHNTPTLNTKPSNLSTLCKRVISNYFVNQSDKRIVEFTCEKDDNRKVNVDELYFNYILTNIISNALKYSKGQRNPELSIHHKKDYLQIKIRDFGIGVPENEIDKLFNSFYRASNSITIPGSGLGLVVAKQFMELHGGSIDLQSKLGGGSTVKLNFPYAKKKNSIG